MTSEEFNKQNYDSALRTFARAFYNEETVLVVDFLCEFGGMDE